MNITAASIAFGNKHHQPLDKPTTAKYIGNESGAKTIGGKRKAVYAEALRDIQKRNHPYGERPKLTNRQARREAAGVVAEWSGRGG